MIIRLKDVEYSRQAGTGHVGFGYQIRYVGGLLHYPYCRTKGQAIYVFVKSVQQTSNKFHIYTDCFELAPRGTYSCQIK